MVVVVVVVGVVVVVVVVVVRVSLVVLKGCYWSAEMRIENALRMPICVVRWRGMGVDWFIN